MSNSSYPLPTVVVHTVHGTWPFGLWCAIVRRQPEKSARGTDSWFLDGSDFQSDVTSLVGRRVKWVPFRWSGKNSFSARLSAATQLSNHLSTWFRRDPDAEHVIIAHSHGRLGLYCSGKSVRKAWRKSTFEDHRYGNSFRANQTERTRHQRTCRALFSVQVWLDTDPDLPGLPLRIWISPARNCTSMACGIYAVQHSNDAGRCDIFGSAMDWAHPTSPPMSDAPKLPLYAIRAPLDEATIAITTSQFIEFLSAFIFSRMFLQPVRWLVELVFGCGVRCQLVAVAFVFTFWEMAEIATSDWKNVALYRLAERSLDAILFICFKIIACGITVIFLAPLLLVVGYMVLALVGPTLLISANAVLAAALGWDVFRNRGSMEIECEPIPSGTTGVISMIKVSETEMSKLGLVHFIHATRGARDRVAEILNTPS